VTVETVNVADEATGGKWLRIGRCGGVAGKGHGGTRVDDARPAPTYGKVVRIVLMNADRC
jgi:hypothetical protein